MWAQISWSFWGLWQAIRSLGRKRLWIPYALLFVVQFFFLLALTNFYRWPFSSVLSPLLRSELGEGAMHYPYNFLALPFEWSRLAVVTDLLFAGLVMGWTYHLVIRSEGITRTLTRSVFKSWWAFILTRLPIQLGLVFVLILLPQMVMGDGGLGGNRLRLFRLGLLFVSITLEAIYLFIPLILLREGAVRAFREGISFSVRHPIISFLLVAIPAMLHLPLLWILGRSQLLIDRMAPEAVGWVVALNILLASFTGYLVVVAAGKIHTAIQGSARGVRE
ncbi:MAG: hypothetical protein KJ970_12120 [Candidatus Eisenbacteria bacterium]|uniref:Uncharacterized protein n=1 Tax=Eiseniibacteriota bacterium TaxID=2212470 RepID=A0A948RY18_UNCEI|nr:hypothetical protein [Candidatus Eisenbacteria bacterium]MBU1949222.1 hypothetical protein [Candidatus Eisenbacteria bacterium]MBU2691663.1 hypothetical protein [Candidatus Eisenbacteria bacterium]